MSNLDVTLPGISTGTAFEVLVQAHVYGMVFAYASKEGLAIESVDEKQLAHICTHALRETHFQSWSEYIAEQILEFFRGLPAGAQAQDKDNDGDSAPSGENNGQGNDPAVAGEHQGDALQVKKEARQYRLERFFRELYSPAQPHAILANQESLSLAMDQLMDLFWEESVSSFNPYQLVLVIERAAATFPQPLRQTIFNALTQTKDSSTGTASAATGVNLREALEQLYAEYVALKDDHEKRRIARLAPPDSQDGVIAMGSLPIFSEGGPRLKDTAPVLRRPIQLVASVSEAHRLLLLAEEELLRNQIGSTWNDAVSLFEQAATAAVISRRYMLAGAAYLRASDCRLFLHDLDSHATYIAEAAEFYRKDRRYLPDSAECFMVAARSISTIRPSFEAKYLRSSAEVCLEDGRFVDAIARFRESAALFQKLKLATDAKSTLRKAIEVAITQIGDVALTIELLEELSELEDQVPQSMTFFQASLCHLYSLPPEYSPDFDESYNEVRKAFDQYTDVCPYLLVTAEGELIRLMLEAFAMTDAEMAELAIARYLTGHTPLPWCVQLCHCIHQNIVEKISSAEKLFKLLPEKGVDGDTTSDRLNGTTKSVAVN